MGQTLSEPLTSKDSSACENSMFKVGSSCMQGWRVSMEDAHVHILSLPEDKEAAFFAVYDGHGGSAIAKHAGSNLHKYITQRPAYLNGDIPTAFREAFQEFDFAMQKDDKLKREVCGTTAVTILIKGNQLYCANVGDSRAVACIKGKCHPLSFDHKPTNPAEEERIKNAGGWVEYNRVNGNLALSRALGDFSFKRNLSKPADEQMVIALPDVETKTITEDWEFVIMACDGIWDVVTNEEACEFVRYPLGSGMTPDKICEQLMTACLAPDTQMGGLGCDNMTVIIICFLHGKPWRQYCSKIASTLEPGLLGFTRRIRDYPKQDSSDDEESAIPDDKLKTAKTISACLSEVLSKNSEPGAGEDAKTNVTSVLQDVMQAEDYIHKGKGGQVVVNVTQTSYTGTTAVTEVPAKDASQSSQLTSMSELFSVLVEEVLHDNSSHEHSDKHSEQRRDSN